MKKCLSVVLALIMAIGLVGCGAEAKPDAVVADFCKAMQKFDLAAMVGYVEGSAEVTDEELAELNEGIPEEMLEYFTAQAGKMTYGIVGVEETDDTAKVTVAFTHTDITPIMGAVFSEYIQQAFAMAFAGATDEAMEELLYTIFDDKVKTVEATTAETTVEFSCVKADTGWVIEELPEDVLHILTCNMAAAFEGLSGEDTADDAQDSEPANWIDVPVGTEVELATVKIKVSDCYETDKLTAEYYEAEVAQEGTKFVVFEMEIENISKENVEFYADEFVLTDGQERKYELHDEAMWYFDDFAVYEEYAPNIKQSGTLVYHVPSDCGGYFFSVRKQGSNDCYKFMGE